MKKMLKRITVLGLAALATPLFLSSAHADTVKWTSSGPGTQAGEMNFTITSTVGGASNIVLDGTTYTNGTVFTSFCLELDEHISPNTNYTALVNNVFGTGVNAGIPAADLGGVATPTNPDPISNQTAYLFNEFINGTLPGYLSDNASADALQFAFWHFEENDARAHTVSAQEASYITLANFHAGDFTNANSLNIGVLNLYDGATKIQSFLIATDGRTTVPVPQAAWAGLALFGGTVVARLRRKNRA